jgi:hypothetical protein
VEAKGGEVEVQEPAEAFVFLVEIGKDSMQHFY